MSAEQQIAEALRRIEEVITDLDDAARKLHQAVSDDGPLATLAVACGLKAEELRAVYDARHKLQPMP